MNNLVRDGLKAQEYVELVVTLADLLLPDLPEDINRFVTKNPRE